MKNDDAALCAVRTVSVASILVIPSDSLGKIKWWIVA